MTFADELSWGEKIAALRRVAAYCPTFTLGLVLFGGLAAVLEDVGLRFIYPILEAAQTEGPTEAGIPYSIPSSRFMSSSASHSRLAI
jgi:subfamily B ATP-binding cassette protein MsbA